MLKVLGSFVITTVIFLWFGLSYWLYETNPILSAIVMIFPVIWIVVYMAVSDILER